MQRTSSLTTVALICALLVALAVPALAQERTFTSPLSGDEEVPPVDTDASGSAQYVLSEDGTQISFTVEVENLEDATMAHIHLGAAGENGPPVVWLHTQDQAPELVAGVTTGTLASGTFAADALVGPLEGGTLEDLVDEMAAGNTYTNVHTQEFGSGEIRGQIAERPSRIDTGGGGTAGSSGLATLALGVAMIMAVVGVAGVAVRRRGNP
ncbi:MAG: CHRD domain-containing protein [Nitriliruptoraceae bacterium]